MHFLQIKIPDLKIVACQRSHSQKVVELKYKPVVNLVLKLVVITITHTASPPLQFRVRILEDQFCF